MKFNRSVFSLIYLPNSMLCVFLFLFSFRGHPVPPKTMFYLSVISYLVLTGVSSSLWKRIKSERELTSGSA
jgi:hypothetical protein